MSLPSLTTARPRNCGKLTALFLCAALVFLATGCWDCTEIENCLFATLLGVDYAANEGYTLALTLPMLSEDENAGADIKKAYGRSLPEALKELDTQSGKKICLGQVKVMVFGENLLNHPTAMDHAAEFLNAHPDIDRLALVLAAEDVCKILESRPPDERLPGIYIGEFFKDGKKSAGQTFRLDFEQLYTVLWESGNVLLPAVSVDDEGLKIEGAYAVKASAHADNGTMGLEAINTDKPTSESDSTSSTRYALDKTELRGLLWTQDKGCPGSVLMRKDNAAPSLTVERHDAKWIFSEENGRLRGEVRVRVSGTAATEEEQHENHRENRQASSRKAIISTDEKEKSESALAKIITEEINATAEKMQTELRMDGYAARQRLRKTNYPLYLKYAKDWDCVFSDMEMVPVVTVSIK